MTDNRSLAEFWNDCQAPPGMRELRLLVDRLPDMPQGFVVQTPFALLGRDEGADVVVDDPEISRRHIYLQIIAGELWSFDLASRTGLHLGEQRLQAATVTSFDGVRVGPCHVHPMADADFKGPGDADPLEPLPAVNDLLPTATLEFRNATQLGGHPAPTWQLDRTVTFVGQAIQCKVRFRCPSVSRVHCALVRTAGGVWAIDLLGRKGISVDGHRVRFAKLTDGAELRVGRFRMIAHKSERRLAVEAESQTLGAPGAMLPVQSSAMQPAAMHPTAMQPLATQSSAPAALPAPIPSIVSLLSSELMISVPPPGSSQALAAAPPELPVPPGLDPTQQMLLTMMHQFSTMQQQMFDQFQQTTMMMMQMFGSLQKDQFELVRRELEGLRELNRELNTVQVELAKHKTAKADSTDRADTAGKPVAQLPKPKAGRAGASAPPRRKRQASPLPSAPPPETPPWETERALAPPRVAATPASGAPASGAPSPDAPLPEPASPDLPRSRAPAETPRLKPPRFKPRAADGVSAQDGAQDAAEDATSPAAAQTSDALIDATTPAGIDVPPGEDVHEWLCRRFADLQQERQTRWQRLMGVLTGK